MEEVEAVRWLLDFVVDQWGDSLPVIIESLESMGAPNAVIEIAREMEWAS